ncbi:Clp protease adapter protein ClpF, chloroplastic [Linum perenne]
MLRGQALSPGTLTTYGNCGVSAKIPSWRRQLRFNGRPIWIPGLWFWRAQGTDLVSNSNNVMGRKSLRVEAGCCSVAATVGIKTRIRVQVLSKAKAAMRTFSSSSSSLISQLVFRYCQATRHYKRNISKSEAQDKAIDMIRLRADLQNAIEKEDYALAAGFRDQISKLEKESLAVSAEALAYANVQYAFRLGQKVKHKIFGYRAVICGMDPVCCESSSWMEAAQIQKLDRGPNQPFYQVLVDVHKDPNLLVTYVAEDSLIAPDKPDLTRFDHPYTSFLFYGVDTAGDFIPVKQLRDKFNRPRHEVPTDPPDENSGGSP